MYWRDAWAHAAVSLKGELSSGTRFLSEHLELTTTIDGVPVRAAFVTGSGEPRARITAAAPRAGELRMQVFRGWVYSLGRAMGIQDLQIGDDAFDDEFVIKGDDIHFVRSWLDPEARAAIRPVERAVFSVKDGRAEAQLLGWIDAPERLEQGVRAVAVLASSGRRRSAAWASAAERLGGALSGDGGWGADGRSWIDVTVRGERVRIDSWYGAVTRRRDRRLYTRAMCKRHAVRTDLYSIVRLDLATLRHHQRWGYTYRVWREDAERFDRRLDDETRKRALAVAPAAIVGGRERVEVLVEGFDATPERLTAMAEVAERLAEDAERTAPSTPYR
jgi:hypothetical protein